MKQRGVVKGIRTDENERKKNTDGENRRGKIREPRIRRMQER